MDRLTRLPTALGQGFALPTTPQAWRHVGRAGIRDEVPGRLSRGARRIFVEARENAPSAPASRSPDAFRFACSARSSLFGGYRVPGCRVGGRPNVEPTAAPVARRGEEGRGVSNRCVSARCVVGRPSTARYRRAHASNHRTSGRRSADRSPRLDRAWPSSAAHRAARYACLAWRLQLVRVVAVRRDRPSVAERAMNGMDHADGEGLHAHAARACWFVASTIRCKWFD